MHMFLLKPHIFSGKSQGYPSRSMVKHIGQITDFNTGHKFISSKDLFYRKQVYLMELHILRGDIIRSRSSFKVKGKKI